MECVGESEREMERERYPTHIYALLFFIDYWLLIIKSIICYCTYYYTYYYIYH